MTQQTVRKLNVILMALTSILFGRAAIVYHSPILAVACLLTFVSACAFYVSNHRRDRS